MPIVAPSGARVMSKGIKGFQKGHTPWNKNLHISLNPKTQFKKGHIISLKIRKKISDSLKGKKPKNFGITFTRWKGNKVGYVALHMWIRKMKGKPEICEHCGNSAKHWANIDHKYRRNLEDYISLCVGCHKKYDTKFLNKGRFYK